MFIKMSEPASKIALPPKLVWEPPLCHTVDHCDSSTFAEKI